MSRGASDRCWPRSLERKSQKHQNNAYQFQGQRSSSITAETKSVSYLPKGRLRNFKTGTPIEHALHQLPMTLVSCTRAEANRVSRTRRPRTLLTYFDFCDHSWLTVNMISASNHRHMSLKFRLLSFLSWNTLSRKHGVGILFTWATKSYVVKMLVKVFSCSFYCNIVCCATTLSTSTPPFLRNRYHFRKSILILDQRSNRPKFGVLFIYLFIMISYKVHEYFVLMYKVRSLYKEQRTLYFLKYKVRSLFCKRTNKQKNTLYSLH